MEAAVTQRKPGRRWIAVAVLIGLVVAGVVGWKVTDARETSAFTMNDSVTSSSGGVIAEDAPMPIVPMDPVVAKQAEAAGYYGDDGTMRDLSVTTAGAPSIAEEVSAPGTAPTIGPRVIKTADLSLILEDDAFSDSFDHASMVAAKFDGFVVNSFTEGTHAKAGTVTIRVPVANYDAALSELRDIGSEIERENASGVDVTDQFVDLEARLRSWEAQQRVLLKLMDRANSIPETMQVQNEIQRVQFEIESIKGQLRVMRDQTSLATITVSMHERGAAAPKGDTDRPSLAVAFDAAIAGFLGVISMVIVGIGYLLPFLLMALVGWFVWRRVRRTPKVAAS